MMMRRKEKINFEEELFKYQLARKGLKYKWSYHKIISSQEGRKVNEKSQAVA